MSILSLQQLQTFRDIKESISSQLRPSINYLASEAKGWCVPVCEFTRMALDSAVFFPSALVKWLLGFSSYGSYYGCMNTWEQFLMHTSHPALQQGPISFIWMSVLALSTGQWFHRQLSLGIYVRVNISCLHASPITSALPQSSASIFSIKSCAKVQNTCANLTVFWNEILDSLGISLVIPWKISHAHSYERQPRSFYILLIRFSLFTTPSAFFL